MVRPPSLRLADWRCLSCGKEFIEAEAAAAASPDVAEALREAINTRDHPMRTNDEIVASVREILEPKGEPLNPMVQVTKERHDEQS
jgi:hypothetical protein